MKNIKYLIIVIVSIVLDQLSKFLIVSNFQLYETKNLIDGFLSLTYVQNTGAGFSILEGRMTFFYIITIVAIVFMLYLFKTANRNALIQRISIAMMIGGALGNFIDRLRLGYVVDFIAVNIFGYHFPVFNLADSFLTVAVIVFIICLLLEAKNGKA